MWSSLGYEEIQTEDGTPSLRSAASVDAEMMHHRGGALTESRLIYGRLVRPALEGSSEARFLSLGLGLGYNEALIAEEALRQKKSWRCVSYEADPVLIHAFRSYLQEELLSNEVGATYQRIFEKLHEGDRVREELARALQDGRWVLAPALEKDSKPPFAITAFLWDAFSQKTSPALWEESFLQDFFMRWSCPERAGLSTYACIGKLKRALRASGFTYEIREGFHGKRHSTFAWRGSGWMNRFAADFSRDESAPIPGIF